MQYTDTYDTPPKIGEAITFYCQGRRHPGFVAEQVDAESFENDDMKRIILFAVTTSATFIKRAAKYSVYDYEETWCYVGEAVSEG